MTLPTPVQDLATQWKSACRLYPIYFELAREFAIDVQACPDLEAGVDTPGKEAVEQANHWLEQMDERVQVHQLRQFLQTNALVNPESLLHLLVHFLTKAAKNDVVRDKVDFLLVQYFSQLAPAGLGDDDVDLAYVAQTLEPILSQVELKAPVWLNALDRILESARRCRSLDELLHGGILEQGRKAKTQAGELFYLPVALVAFTRFGYLMRRVFFRLMLGDLNIILDGLTELEEKGIETIDCRRAQFSAQEPILRLRMICQSWKVMFQAEYSSGQPLRMLVDLRASVEAALGKGKASETADKAGKVGAVPAQPLGKSQPVVKTQPKPTAATKAPPSVKAATAAVASAGNAAETAKPAGPKAPTPSGRLSNASTATSKLAAPSKAKAAAAHAEDVPEFEVSGTPGWDADIESDSGSNS
jgi:hypothetical protein